jgi:hypothetical protein
MQNAAAMSTVVDLDAGCSVAAGGGDILVRARAPIDLDLRDWLRAEISRRRLARLSVSPRDK